MAHPELNEVLDALFSFAQEMLAKNGEFYPFGATMDSDGKVGMAAGYTGDEHPPSQEVIDLLVGGFRDMVAAGKIRASGICLDVRTIPPGETKKVDAICARLEHNSGELVHVFQPYRKKILGGIKYGEIFATEGEKEVFDTSKK